MAWVRIEDTVTEHRKHLQAGPAASWLWVCGLAYCQRQLSDGFIPDAVVPLLGVSRGVSALLVKLVEVGLFDRVEGGYRVHDYHDFNETREQAMARRLSMREQRRSAGRASGRSRSVERETNGAVESVSNPDPTRPIPSHPIPSDSKSSPSHGARRALTGGGVFGGALPREHLRHAWCGRKCVPDFLHGEFVRAFGGDPDATKLKLSTFYEDTCAKLPEGPVGDEPVKFWRDHFSAAFSTPKADKNRFGTTVEQDVEAVRAQLRREGQL